MSAYTKEWLIFQGLDVLNVKNLKVTKTRLKNAGSVNKTSVMTTFGED